ncbi:hypothetical protein BD770DRAFT_22951 [Pilaira anomala]|nr:hypothetical protein BD770DRAFT_22951 [Pilaira anomala]
MDKVYTSPASLSRGKNRRLLKYLICTNTLSLTVISCCSSFFGHIDVRYLFLGLILVIFKWIFFLLMVLFLLGIIGFVGSSIEQISPLAKIINFFSQFFDIIFVVFLAKKKKNRHTACSLVMMFMLKKK